MGYIGLCFSIVGLIVNRVLVSRKIQESSAFKLEEQSSPLNKKELTGFLSYVKSGIELKELRFTMLAIALALSLCFLCLTVGDILFSSTSILEVGMAILIGIVFTYALFVKDLFELNKMKQTVGEMIAEVE